MHLHLQSQYLLTTSKTVNAGKKANNQASIIKGRTQDITYKNNFIIFVFATTDWN